MAQNRKDRRVEPTAPVKPAPIAASVAELETLPITQEGWIGEPISMSDDRNHEADRIDALPDDVATALRRRILTARAGRR